MEVLTLGHRDLHKIAAEVIDFGSDALFKDIDSLKKTMKLHGGMGIAAPQLGINRRILLIHSKPNSRYPLAPHSDLMVLVNPTFTVNVDELEDWEGCLSVPGIRGLVRRPTQVSVNYFDKFGKSQQKSFDGFLARIFLHEYDHLEGLTFLNRVDDNSKLISEVEYKKLFS
ncbi:MAG: peptide deformylase [Lentisphaeraceae bacterium]|nr:peptide deformylase [Lentisphaeraceae bacterium]